MSEMSDAFSSAMYSIRKQSAKVEGDLVLRPTEFTLDWVEGNIVGGPKDGELIKVRYPIAKDCLASQEHFTTNPKSSNSGYVDIDRGGTLRLERVAEGKDGIFDCHWMMHFRGCPQQRYYIVVDAHCKYVATGRRDSKNRPIATIWQIFPDTEETVSTYDEILDAIQECFRTHEAAILIGKDQEDGRILEMVYYLGGETIDGVYIKKTPEEQIAEIQAFYEAEGVDEKFDNVLGKNDISVTAMTLWKVGPKTVEKVEKVLECVGEKKIRITSVDPTHSDCPGIGSRFATVINRNKDDRNALPEGVAEKFTKAFKAQADADDLEALATHGWKGISDHTLTTFCANYGVKLKQHPSRGWTWQAMVADRLGNYSIGRRIDMAIGKAISEKIGKELATEFVDWAKEEKIEDLGIVLATFEAKGWKAMSDKVLSDFIVVNSEKALIEDAIIDRRDGVIVNTFRQKWANPYPDLRVCKDMKAEYWGEIPKTITGVVENLSRMNIDANARAQATKPAAETKPAADAGRNTTENAAKKIKSC